MPTKLIHLFQSVCFGISFENILNWSTLPNNWTCTHKMQVVELQKMYNSALRPESEWGKILARNCSKHPGDIAYLLFRKWNCFDFKKYIL